MTAELRSYEALVAFSREDRKSERDITIRFLATDDEAACLGVYRWFQNRHAAIPEHFTALHCIKVYRLTLTTFQEDGYLPGGIGIELFEWKSDWHPEVPFEAYLADKMRQRRDRH